MQNERENCSFDEIDGDMVRELDSVSLSNFGEKLNKAKIRNCIYIVGDEVYIVLKDWSIQQCIIEEIWTGGYITVRLSTNSQLLHMSIFDVYLSVRDIINEKLEDISKIYRQTTFNLKQQAEVWISKCPNTNEKINITNQFYRSIKE